LITYVKTMIKQAPLEFLPKLKQNNSREWFEQYWDLYENYRSDLLQLTENLLKELSKQDSNKQRLCSDNFGKFQDFKTAN
ncbi:MAG: DUF2461 domain-containing protein, partial [Enterococcus sp.]|nr:DUF2461 domain-containing protein [Enterococcus sp.]